MKAGVLSSVAGLVIAALVLAACGTTTISCRHITNISPGTAIAGPVSIATDHSVYAPGEVVQTTVTNHLQQAIVIYNELFTAYCPYFELQMRVGNDWQDLRNCILPTGGDTQLRNEPQRIAVDGSFTSAVPLRADLATGTYRLWISRYFVTDARGGPVGSGGTAESATFQICACGVCE